MKLSRERLEHEAEQTGFRAEILEKVLHLLDILNTFAENNFLNSRIALKGGTALNVFCFDHPKLSVDIDINYIGSPDRTIMLSEKQKIMDIVENICSHKGYQSQRKPSEHAGGKWILRFQSVLQGTPRLEIDLNFLTRVPLWPVKPQRSFDLGSFVINQFPILDKHELAGGKLKALFSRHSSRDLFDAYLILTNHDLDMKKLRIAFLVYGAMSRIDWRAIKPSDIQFDWAELQNMLLPMLKKPDIEKLSNIKDWTNNLLSGCHDALSNLIPFKENERAFLASLLDHAEIKPELLTNDTTLIKQIKLNPGLKWKAHHVKLYKT